MHHPPPSCFRQDVAAAVHIEPAQGNIPNWVRLDAASASAVEVAISLQGLLGTPDAASFLKNQRIDIAVALRVLLTPSRRRQD